MTIRSSFYFGALFATAMVAAAACGDDEDTNTTTRTTTAASSPASASASAASSGAGGAGLTCAEGCDILYDCGADGECPGFSGDAGEKAAFVEGCIETCMGSPALLALIDESDCAGTVTQVSAVSTDFAAVCENGFGGAGGTGGAGGEAP
jgi:hypothetical protein